MAIIFDGEGQIRYDEHSNRIIIHSDTHVHVHVVRLLYIQPFVRYAYGTWHRMYVVMVLPLTANVRCKAFFENMIILCS